MGRGMRAGRGRGPRLRCGDGEVLCVRSGEHGARRRADELFFCLMRRVSFGVGV